MKRKISVIALLYLVCLVFSSLGAEEQDVETLIKRLGAATDWGRADAAWRLGRIGEPAKAAVPALIEALNDESARVRVSAALAVYKLDNSKVDMVLPVLTNVLESETYSTFRADAAEALGEIGPAAKDAIPVLIQALNDEDRQVRSDAARALYRIDNSKLDIVLPILIEALATDGHWGLHYFPISSPFGALIEIGSPAVPALIQALGNENPMIRSSAASLLYHLKPPAKDAVPALTKALSDENWMVRRSAAGALGAIGEPANDALPALMDALSDENPGVRVNAALAVYRLDSSKLDIVLPVLADALEDEDEEVVGQAIGALEMVGEPAVPVLIRAVKDVKIFLDVDGIPFPIAASALLRIGERAIPALSETLSDKDKEVRATAASILCHTFYSAYLFDIAPPEISSESFPRIYKDLLDSSLTRTVAVPALGRSLLSDEDEEIRSTAANTLGYIGDPAAVPALMQALTDQNEDVRLSAVVGLGLIGPAARDAVPELTEALKDEDEWFRIKVCGALGTIGGPTAVSALIQALSDPESIVRGSAASLLGDISPAAKDAVPALMEALSLPGESSGVRVRAACALCKIDSSKRDIVVPVLIQALGDFGLTQTLAGGGLRVEERDSATEALVEFGAPIVPVLVEALDDSNWRIRYEIVGVLEKIGPAAKDAVPALIQALSDEHLYVRRDAVTALGEIGPAAKAAVPVLIHVLRLDNSAWDGIAMDTGDPFPVGKPDNEFQVRLARRLAATALGKIGDPAAVPALVQALNHEDEKVRNNAAEALEMIGTPEAMTALERWERSKDN